MEQGSQSDFLKKYINVPEPEEPSANVKNLDAFHSEGTADPNSRNRQLVFVNSETNGGARDRTVDSIEVYREEMSDSENQYEVLNI